MAFAWMTDLNTRTAGRSMTSAELDEFDKHRSEYDRLTGVIEALGGPDAPTPDLRARVGSTEAASDVIG